jgi:UDP-N-acetyl-2-amino-2-deoxyglucuronate dehydrogenase
MECIHNRKIHFALAGCGRISKNHFQAIEAHREHAELVAVCDPDPTALANAASETQAIPFLHYEEMLRDANADVIVLTTPSGLHPAQTIKAAQAKKHVVTEKPMATKFHDGLHMIRACDDADVHLFVVKQNRFNPPLQQLKKAIQQNRFGKLYSVNVNVFWTRPQSYYDSASWRGTKQLDGGALMNQASHYIDLLTWLIGPIERLQAYTATLGRQIEVEDSGVMAIKWQSGTLGTVNVTMLTYPRNYEGSITVLGEKGTVKVGGMAVNEIQKWEFETPYPEDDKIRENNYVTESVYGNGHLAYYKNVIDVLQGKAKPETDGREGLKSLEVLCAAYLSAEQAAPVSMPFLVNA